MSNTSSERERFEPHWREIESRIDGETSEQAIALMGWRAGWQAAKADAAGQQEPHLGVVLRITTAYEQGFGHALRSELINPYAPGTQEREAWDHGQKVGARKTLLNGLTRAETEATASVAGITGLKPLPGYGDHYTLAIFHQYEDSGGITQDDGSGVYATADRISDVDCFGDAPAWATHVVWFNK